MENPPPETVEQLQNLLDQLKGQQEGILQEIRAAKEKSLALHKEITDVTTRLKKLTSVKKNIQVSDHALVRWFERVWNLNLELARKQILAHFEINQPMEPCSIAKGGHVAEIEDGVIATILFNFMKKKRDEKPFIDLDAKET
jgi:hypothetical protein